MRRAVSSSLGLFAAWAIAFASCLAAADDDKRAPNKPAPDLAQQFLAGPMKDVEDVVFATREVLGEHWYANIGYYSTDRQSPLYRKGGRLCKLNLRTGKLTVLIDDPEGSVRDPAVHYDGRRIAFAYRKGGTENYLLYTINSDGSSLAQLTTGLYDDYEPCWLPDDGLVFVTTRAKRWVGCWLTQVGNVWRCDAGGKELRPLSANLEHDNTPWVMSDGRILHMRWEYIDRSQVDYHHLWTMNPDGTNQAVYFGNLHPGGVYLDAKPIPGSGQIVLIHSPGHGQTEHMGFLATLDIKGGPDDLARLHNISRQADFRDPWAFGDGAFMAAEENRLVLVDGQGRTATLFTLPKEFGNAWLHEPRPLVARDREANIPPVAKLPNATGRFMLDNVYRGRNLAGVKPGEIKRLMVVESLPKPVNFTGGMDPLSYKGTFTLERVLGTVPVDPDGSAYFEAPALRSLFFIALDENGRSVKRMQSFTTVQPGETLGCLGCHENRTTSPPLPQRGSPGAARHRPSKIEPYAGVPDVLDFPRDIQPVLDRLCVQCHNDQRRDGGVLLTGDRGPMFSHGYYTLSVWKQIADGRNYAKSNYPPRTLGSGGSPLMDKLDRRHYEVQATERDRLLVRLWLDVGAPYPGTYAALGCGSIGGYIQNNQVLNNDADWPETKAAQPVFAERCVGCHASAVHPVAHTLSDEIGLSFWEPDMNDARLKYSRHIVYNLSRPERSLVLLAPLARRAGGYGLCRPKGAPAEPGGEVFASRDDPGYRLLLAMCEAGRRKLDAVKRFDMPGFRPRPEYVREMKRFGVLPESFDLAQDPLDVYDADRRYWESLEYRPAD
ncbi:MAG: HzsA-related protein [Pirellulales bacterium]